MSTIVKALALLDLFNDVQPMIGLTEAQRLTGRDKATVHRHLTALEKCGFLERDAQTRAYRLGPTLTRLAAMRGRTITEVEMLRPVLETVSREAGELVHVSRLQGFDLVHVHHEELHNHPVRVSFDAYGLPPLFATASGKAFLAFSPPELLPKAIADPRTRLPDSSSPDAQEIAAELQHILSAGYASARDALHMGVSSVAIPMFDAVGLPFATCSIAYPTGRGGECAEERFAHLLMRRGRQISEAMGGTVPSEVLDLWTASSKRGAR